MSISLTLSELNHMIDCDHMPQGLRHAMSMHDDPSSEKAIDDEQKLTSIMLARLKKNPATAAHLLSRQVFEQSVAAAASALTSIRPYPAPPASTLEPREDGPWKKLTAARVTTPKLNPEFFQKEETPKPYDPPAAPPNIKVRRREMRRSNGERYQIR